MTQERKVRYGIHHQKKEKLFHRLHLCGRERRDQAEVGDALQLSGRIETQGGGGESENLPVFSPAQQSKHLGVYLGLCLPLSMSILFLLLSARGWRTSREKYCVVFFCFFRGWGLLGSQGEPGFYFFLPGFYGKAAFWGKIREASFCLSFCSPSLFFVFVFSMYLMFFFCYNFGVRGFLWTRFLSC